MNCITCDHPLSGLKRKYCSIKCKSSHTNNKHQNYKSQQQRGLERKKHLISLKGGKCEMCGYNKNVAGLCFHHNDPHLKEYKLDLRHCSNTRMDKLLREAEKCTLLCHNCHAEIHHPNM